MKIGLIAMSGIRADDPELTKLGLSMPGIMERGHVIASLPSLSLLTLAGVTPADVEVEYREVRDLAEVGLGGLRAGSDEGAHALLRGEDAASSGTRALPMDYDLVAISSLSAQVLDAYVLADRYRAAGAAVVMGGLHVTAVPEDAAPHCTSIVVGEAEGVWPRLVEDFRRGGIGGLKPRYDGDGSFDLRRAPMPRYELLEVEKYNRIPVQTCRGCPHKCEFCASSIMLTGGYKLKPVEKVIAEVRKVKSLWRHPFIELADDNSFCSRGHARRLLAALKAERVRWFTECDISIAEDEALLDAMREAGCREVLIGLESPTAAGLSGIELRRDWKLRQLDKYEEGVRRIQSRGIAVNGCFVLGLDGDTPATFDEVYRFAERTSLFDVQVTVMTPFPGTPLYARLLAEGRILRPGAWNKCTLFDVNFVPRGMTAAELAEGFRGLISRVYDPGFIRARREGFIEQCRRGAVRPLLGVDGREYSAAVA
ncbi:MAG: radical SAM protein [Phycisphaerales bacterium]